MKLVAVDKTCGMESAKVKTYYQFSCLDSSFGDKCTATKHRFRENNFYTIVIISEVQETLHLHMKEKRDESLRNGKSSSTFCLRPACRCPCIPGLERNLFCFSCKISFFFFFLKFKLNLF
jgi:hypothetical protein